jgi:hypothetical protein
MHSSTAAKLKGLWNSRNYSGPRTPGRWRVRGSGVAEAGERVGERAPEIVNQGPLAGTSGMKG